MKSKIAGVALAAVMACGWASEANASLVTLTASGNLIDSKGAGAGAFQESLSVDTANSQNGFLRFTSGVQSFSGAVRATVDANYTTPQVYPDLYIFFLAQNNDNPILVGNNFTLNRNGISFLPVTSLDGAEPAMPSESPSVVYFSLNGSDRYELTYTNFTLSGTILVDTIPLPPALPMFGAALAMIAAVTAGRRSGTKALAAAS